jgi:hypothetical protein
LYKSCIADFWCSGTSFTEKLKTDRKKPIVQLNFLDQKTDKKLERAGSVTSLGSSIGSDTSGHTSAEKVVRLEWIEIEFASVRDRDEFVRLWQAESNVQMPISHLGSLGEPPWNAHHHAGCIPTLNRHISTNIAHNNV